VVHLLLLVLGTIALRADGGELEGTWVGTLPFPDGARQLLVRFEEDPDGLAAAATLVEDDVRATLPVEVDGEGRLVLSLATPEFGRLEMTLDPAEERASGSVRGAGAPLPFVLVRTLTLTVEELAPFVGHYAGPDGDRFFLTWAADVGLALLDFDGPGRRAARFHPLGPDRFVELDERGNQGAQLLFEPERGAARTVRWILPSGSELVARRVEAAPFRMEEVRFDAGDGVVLAGMLLEPAGKGPFPAVAYVHGSGGNNTRIDHWDLAVCEHLARHGIAVLIPDKRGSGRSGGDWRKADFSRLADDALAAVQVLRGRATVRSGRVGVVGLSQGGTIAPLIAARGGERVAYVVALSPSAVDLFSSTTHEVEELARRAGADEQGLEQIRAIQRAARAWLGGEQPVEAYLGARVRALAGSAAVRGVARGFPADPAHWKWDFHRRVGNFDPMPYWEGTGQPALVVWGAEDELVPVTASEARLRPCFERAGVARTIRIFEESGHALGDPATGWIRREVLELLVDWISSR
jgi:pimeloyl-ACP methyl ester carboxylesterase